MRFICLGLMLALMTTAHSAVPTAWAPRGVGGGGALFAPSISPHDANRIYIACDMSEVFASLDFGLNWSVVDHRELRGGRLAQVQYSSDPNILYAIDYRNDAQYPVRSTDGGATWSTLAGDPTEYPGAFSIWVHPSNPAMVLVTDYSNLYFSNNSGATFSASKYSFDATTNGLFIAGVYWEGTNIYLGTSAGLLVSLNTAGSFALATTGGLPANEEIASLCGAQNSGTLRLYALTVPKGTTYPGIMIEDLFSAQQAKPWTWTRPNANWTAAGAIPDADARPVFIATARNWLNDVYLAGGVNGIDEPRIYKSVNSGQTWSRSLNIANNQNAVTGWAGAGGDRQWSYGGGIVGFAVAPNDSSRAAFTDYGFCHGTSNGGTTWRQMYVNPADEHPAGSATPTRRTYHSIGLEDTTSWNMTWLTRDILWGCQSDIRGIRSVDRGVGWGFDYSGHTANTSYDCVKHPTTGKAYLAISSVHDLYQSTYLTDARIDGGAGQVLVSSDNGLTWTVLHDFGDPVYDLELDPTDTNTLYACVVNSTSGGIYVTRNLQLGASSTWTKLAVPPRTQGHPFAIKALNDGSLACSYSGRRDTVGTFAASSGIYVSTNDGVSWTDRSHANMTYWTKDLVIDPHDPTQNTWYVGVFSGWGGPTATNNQAGGLYRTTNRGQNWTRLINYDLIPRVESVTLHPGFPDEMYVTTETDGLWFTSNARATTPIFSVIGSYPFSHPVRVVVNPYNLAEIWVTSFGNGFRVGSLESAAQGWWNLE